MPEGLREFVYRPGDTRSAHNHQYSLRLRTTHLADAAKDFISPSPCLKLPRSHWYSLLYAPVTPECSPSTKLRVIPLSQPNTRKRASTSFFPLIVRTSYGQALITTTTSFTYSSAFVFDSLNLRHATYNAK
jgi:hypothetical protein